MITLAAQGVSVAIQLASAVILARLLSPDDYGIMAMVLAITAFAGLFRDMGLSAAAVQKESLDHAEMSNLFWVNVAMGTLLTVLLAAASPLVAKFYGKPEVALVTLLLSTTFLIGSLGAQHDALMQRNLRFGPRAVIGICGALATLVVSTILALRGAGYWSLAWGNLVGVGVTTCLFFSFSPFRPGLWTRKGGMGAMLRFGANITAADIISYFQRNLDNILIGRLCGAGSLGQYSRAFSLLMLPITAIRGPINAVAYAVFCRLQGEPEQLRHYYLKVTSVIALLSMPMVAYLLVASGPVIGLLLGDQWREVSSLFSYLAFAAFIQPASGLAGGLLLSRGRGDKYLVSGIYMTIFISFCIGVGVIWGPKGVAIAYSIGTYVALYPWLRWIFKGTGISFGMFANACKIPVLMSVCGGLAAFVAGRLYWADSDVVNVVVLGGAFVLGGAIPVIFLKDGKSLLLEGAGLFKAIRG